MLCDSYLSCKAHCQRLRKKADLFFPLLRSFWCFNALFPKDVYGPFGIFLLLHFLLQGFTSSRNREWYLSELGKTLFIRLVSISFSVKVFATFLMSWFLGDFLTGRQCPADQRNHGGGKRRVVLPLAKCDHCFILLHASMTRWGA